MLVHEIPHLVVLVLVSMVTQGSTTSVIDVSVDLQTVVAQVSERYLSVCLDSGIIRERWPHWDFSSRRLQTLAAGLSPAYIRMGGTDADFLIFEPNQTDPKSSQHGLLNQENWLPEPKVHHVQLDSCDGWKFCKPKHHTNYTMTASDWDSINTFSRKAGWRMVFDFNVFLKTPAGMWSTQNAKLLLDYSHQKGYTDNMDFELGNEPNAYFHNFNFSISGAQMGQDFIELYKLIHQTQGTSSSSSSSPSLLVGPDITRPRGKHSKSLKYLKQFLPVAKDVVDAITWHQYYVNGRTAVVSNFTDPDVLELLRDQLMAVQGVLRSARLASSKKVWLGETSSAWGGGAKGLSDTYVAGFMWLDKLGLSALYGVNTIMRQSFFRGHYALLDNDQQPRPDYWLSLLFKRLVGTEVFRVNVNEDPKSVRLYAHCTNIQKSGYPRGSVTLYGMNLKDEDVTLNLRGDLGNQTVDQYLMTPHTTGKLTSALVRLNGKTLKMLNDVTLPRLFPKKTGDKIILPSKTFGFFVIPSVKGASSQCT